MKKQRILVMICLFGLWIVSCVKENETPNTKVKEIDKTSTAQLLKHLKTNTYEGAYLMNSHSGHTASDCGGNCTVLNGVRTHVDCQGAGNKCGLIATINISKNKPDDVTDIYYNGIGINNYEPIDEGSTFNMPARSLYIEDDNFENGFIYLNIPEQILQRNEETNLFIYKDITFSDSPLFENL